MYFRVKNEFGPPIFPDPRPQLPLFPPSLLPLPAPSTPDSAPSTPDSAPSIPVPPPPCPPPPFCAHVMLDQPQEMGLWCTGVAPITQITHVCNKNSNI